MTLTVVGCSGSTSGPDSPASSYLLQAPWQGRTYTVLLDCGPGAFGQLSRYVPPEQIDAVALSHLHPDHCLDLCAFSVAARYSPTAPWEPVDLWAPPHALERLGRAYDPMAGDDATDLGTVFTAHTWEPHQQLGPFTVTAARVAHPAPCWATRFETGGRSLVYSGDTGPSPALVDLARGADLLLCEAAFTDPAPGGEPNPPGLHLTGREAGRAAADAGVGRLVVTHVPPWHRPDEAARAAASAFDGPVEVATSGARWTL